MRITSNKKLLQPYVLIRQIGSIAYLITFGENNTKRYVKTKPEKIRTRKKREKENFGIFVKQ